MLVRSTLVLALCCISMDALAARRPKKEAAPIFAAPEPEPEPAPAPPPEPVETTTVQTQTVTATPEETRVSTRTETTTVAAEAPLWDYLGGGIVENDHSVGLTLGVPTLAFFATYMHGVGRAAQIGVTVGTSSFYATTPVLGAPRAMLALSLRFSLVSSRTLSMGLRLDPYVAMGTETTRLALGAGLRAQLGILRWVMPNRLGVGAAVEVNVDVPILQTATYRVPALAGLIAEYHFSDNFGLYATALAGATFDPIAIGFAVNATLGASAHF